MPDMRVPVQLLATLVFFAAACGGSDPGAERGGAGGGAAGTGVVAMGAAGSRAGAPATGVAGAAGAPAAVSSSGGTMAGSGGLAGTGTPSTMEGTAGKEPVVPNEMGSLFPIKTGNSWTFKTTKGSEVRMKTQSVGALEMVGGTGPKSATMAYKMLTTKDDGMDKTESWQAEVDGKIVRYRERSFAASNGALELEEHWDPYKLRIDGTQLTVGATYTERYNETKLMVGMPPATAMSSDTWKVVALNEMVTVPAGTFSAVVIEKVGGTSTKRYWFARGVGKVKEQSGSQIEELTSYTVMP